MRIRKMLMIYRALLTFISLVLCLFVYNEFLIYYVTLIQCSWPNLESSMLDLGVGSNHHGELKAMILADTHLLGSREGNWFDRLRREWQMERSFQTALTIFNPDVVFILGDLFDEGKWCSDTEFHYYVTRFHKMFRHSEDTQLHVVVGNHDIGFHYMISEQKYRRFSNALDSPSVNFLQIKDNIFILMNSMAFEGDGCNMCQEAEKQLDEMQWQLDCSQGTVSGSTCDKAKSFKYTRPILMQHFPMFRTSDSNCSGPDSAPPNEKYVAFKPKFDCLSKSASNKLFKSFKPRLIVNGHTHHFCHRTHKDGTPEWTVPSFSWRNKPNPSFLMMTLNNDQHSISKCYLPEERTVINTYIVGGALIVFWFLWHKLWRSRAGYRDRKAS